MTDDLESEEIESEVPLYLHDGECWVSDPEYLAHDSGVQGVIAIQFRDGALWYLDGETRKWMNAEADTTTKRATLSRIQ